jgi:transposase
MTNRPAQYKSKAAFIREHGVEKSADEIVSAGKRAGLEIKPQDVHAVRYVEKQRQAASKPKPNGKHTKPKKGKQSRELEPTEVEFRKLAVRLGFDRAQAMLEQMLAEVAV